MGDQVEDAYALSENVCPNIKGVNDFFSNCKVRE